MELTTKFGNKPKDQKIEEFEKGLMFVSYGTNIVFKDFKGNIFLDENNWDYSRTTGQYRNQFLNSGIAETRKRIKSGEYKLVDLKNKKVLKSLTT